MANLINRDEVEQVREWNYIIRSISVQRVITQLLRLQS
jgi:hypothetical protein